MAQLRNDKRTLRRPRFDCGRDPVAANAAFDRATRPKERRTDESADAASNASSVD
jgi:hypothetical protein